MADRRIVLKWAAAGTLASLAGFNAPIALASPTSKAIVPEGNFLLTRNLVRYLGPDAQISVGRVWKVAFTKQEGGWMVQGDQLSVTVDAPPAFAPLAEIERNRNASEIIPVLLTVDGRIRHAADVRSELDMQEVATAAEQTFAGLSSSKNDKAALRQFLGALQSGAGQLISRLPDDLFFPDCKPVTQKRSLEVPGGGTGEIEMTYVAHACPDTGLLETSERKVTTRLGGSEMLSAENWALAAV